MYIRCSLGKRSLYCDEEVKLRTEYDKVSRKNERLYYGKRIPVKFKNKTTRTDLSKRTKYVFQTRENSKEP